MTEHASDSHASPALPADVESRPGLLRVMGLGMGVAMVVGNVIGSGIFLKPGAIAAAAGEFGLILTAWIVGGVLCILGGLCFAELGAMMPRAGGLYVYLREAYGRPVAFLFGWIEFLFGKPASIGALSVAFVGAFGKAIGYEFSLLTGVLFALLLIGGMTWINVIGAIWGGRMQAGTTLIKAGFLGVIALLPFLVMAFGYNEFATANYGTQFTPSEETSTITKFAVVMLAVMWAYNGWHGIAPISEEVRDPQRNIPLSLFVGIGILIVLYLGANFAYHGVLTMTEMADAGKHGAQRMVEKLFTPGGPEAVQTAVAVMSAVIMCSTFGAINANTLNGPRISFAMGRDDVFFRQLGRVHVNYRTPATAILVQSTMAASLVVISGALVKFIDGFQQTSIFELLTNFVVFSASIFYMLAVFAVIVLRRKRPDWPRPYRTLGYPFVPILYLVFYTWFLGRVFRSQPFESLVGLGLIALGIPVYFGWRAWASRHPDSSET